MIGDIIRREMLTGQVDLKSMETQNCDEQPIIDTHTNHLTMLQSKIVSYMISKRFRQLNADVLINIDECHENDICLLIDDEPEPMPIDNHATGLGELLTKPY